MDTVCHPRRGVSGPVVAERLVVVLDSTTSYGRVDEVVRACSHHLRSYLYLRRSMTFHVANTLACGIAGSRIDYCNALLVRASVTRRSTDFNECSTDSRVSFSTSGYASRTLTAVPLADLLRGLRRLPTESRIGFTIAVICFKSHRLEIPALSRIASSTT